MIRAVPGLPRAVPAWPALLDIYSSRVVGCHDEPTEVIRDCGIEPIDDAGIIDDPVGVSVARMSGGWWCGAQGQTW